MRQKSDLSFNLLNSKIRRIFMQVKFILIVSVLLFLAVAGFSQEERIYYPDKTPVKRVAGEPAQDLPPLDEWDQFQLAFAPGFPSATNNSNVYGLKLGILASSGKGRVWGVEASAISSSTDNIKGFQTSVFANVAKFLDGVQAGLINIVSISGDGIVQFGLVNYSDETGIQFGLVNVIPKGFFPFMLIFNMQPQPVVKTYIQKAPPAE